MSLSFSLSHTHRHTHKVKKITNGIKLLVLTSYRDVKKRALHEKFCLLILFTVLKEQMKEDYKILSINGNSLYKSHSQNFYFYFLNLLSVINNKGGLPWWLRGNESACQPGDMSLTRELGRSPGGENDNPLHQYSCLKNPMDRGAWQVRVHRVSKSQTQLKQLTTHTTTKTKYNMKIYYFWLFIFIKEICFHGKSMPQKYYNLAWEICCFLCKK